METLESVKEYFANNKDLPFASDILSIKLLSGGLVNFVYRVIFDNNSSVVLKYFPPYLKINNSIQMSQERYFVEKAALEIFHSQPWLKKNPSSKIRTPKLLHADDKIFVLIMEDAGQKADTLFNYLIQNSNLETKFIESFAKDIKFFLNYLTNESNITPSNNEVFKNKCTSDILEYIPRVWSEMLKKLEIEELNSISIENKSKNDQNLFFVFGDLWPSSILIDKEKELIWIIDWEMARFGNKTGDLEQLMANLWIMKQSTKFDQIKIDELIKKIQKEFYGEENLDWRKQCGDFGTKNFIQWVVCLLNETHWGIDNIREVTLKALNEIK